LADEKKKRKKEKKKKKGKKSREIDETVEFAQLVADDLLCRGLLCRLWKYISGERRREEIGMRGKKSGSKNIKKKGA